MKPPLILLVGLIFGSVLFGLATLSSSALILSIPLLAYLYVAIYRRPEEIRLAVQREIFPEQAPQGTPFTVKLTVTNKGRALDELVVEEVGHGSISKQDEKVIGVLSAVTDCTFPVYPGPVKKPPPSERSSSPPIAPAKVPLA